MHQYEYCGELLAARSLARLDLLFSLRFGSMTTIAAFHNDDDDGEGEEVA